MFSVLMKNAKTCRYLGLHHVEGKKCHHIAATQEDIDWQIWVDSGDVARLRKIVITYKQLAGSPQYTALIKNFSNLDTVPDDTFVSKLPEGATKISLLPVIDRINEASENDM